MRIPKEYTKPAFDEDLDVALDEPYQLIVWNDDVNTFDWVIETLITVCGHTQEQAEQCTLLIHYKGKCDVKRGSYEELEPHVHCHHRPPHQCYHRIARRLETRAQIMW